MSFTPLGSSAVDYLAGGFGNSGLGYSNQGNPLSLSSENLGMPPVESYYPPRTVPNPAERADEGDQVDEDRMLAYEPDDQLQVANYGGGGNDGLPGGLDEDQASLSLDEEIERPNVHQVDLRAFSGLRVSTVEAVPAPFGGSICEARNSELEPVLTQYLALEKDFLKVASSSGAANFFEPFSILQKRLDEIWATVYILEAQDMHILMHKTRIMLPVYIKQAQNWTKHLEGAKVANPVSIFLIESPIPHAPKRSKTGPWVFKLVVAPGFNLATNTPLTVVANSIESSYDVKIEPETVAAAKPVLPAVLTADLERGKNPDEFVFDSISFSVPSNGKPFQVEFKFTVYMQNKTSYSCVVLSLPFTTLSNVNQWKQGENRYVAYHAFGELRGPLKEVPYPAFFNALQFEYLTSTRQLGSEGYLSRLKAKHDEAKQHFKKKKIKKDSERSETHELAISLYENYVNFQRFVRPLMVDEVKAIFPPKSKPSGRGTKQIVTEWMEHEAFTRTWRDWYGELAYRLYTGQSSGDEPRCLFLDGLIHIITPHTGPQEGILDPAIYPPGTAIIRTSSKAGQFTYNVIVVTNGIHEVIFKRVEAPGSEYSTALFNEGYIHSLVNIQGQAIPKMAIINKYREIAAASDNPRYRANIADTTDNDDMASETDMSDVASGVDAFGSPQHSPFYVAPTYPGSSS